MAHLSLSPGSQLRFYDSVVSPPVETRAEVKELDLSNLNLADPSQRTDIRLGLDFEGLGDLSMSGWAKPLDLKSDFDLKAEINGLSLPVASPYYSEVIGQHLESGLMWAKADATARDGQLEGQVDLTIDKLRLEEFSDQDKRRVAEDLGIPVELVVKLIENSDQEIVLTVPLSARRRHRSLASVMRSERLSAAPWPQSSRRTSLLTCSPAGRTAMPSSRLSFFHPGSIDLDEDGRRLVDQIAALLTERPELEIIVCGRVTAADLTDGRQAGMSESELFV